MIKYGSICSGIEAATVAWDGLGWEPAWFSEIERFPNEVLAYHYPDVSNVGDMMHIKNAILLGEIEAPDILCGGTPCQSFSVAGRRESLDNPNGNLALEFCNIADAVDAVRIDNGRQESIILWENVPGVLNTKDNAFGSLLGQLAGEAESLQPSGKKWTHSGVVLGPKRNVAWRILDAQYFGLAQRRKRVFVIASARDGFNPAEILFEPAGVQRNTAPSRGQRQEDTRHSSKSFRESGFGQFVDSEVAGTLKATGGVLQGGSETITFSTTVADISPTLTTGFGARGVDPNQIIDGGCALGIAGNSIGRKPSNGPNGVRKLTPIECERLQGFPDNYTQIPWRGKPADQCPLGHRYKAIGNSWAVNVVRWIGQRIDLEMKAGDLI